MHLAGRNDVSGVGELRAAGPERCQGNKREACRVLDISYHTLQSYLRFPLHDPEGAGDDPGTASASEPWREDPDPAGEVEVESMV
jgi:hypothetical protein